MGFVINNRIWELAEKLYIHCYQDDGFVKFLKSKSVNLPDDFYSNFEIYSFMSSEQNHFAQLMQRVPAYRYLSILEGIIFDENIISTQRDNWNYYGNYIKKWYPELLDQIKKAGLKIDTSKKKIITKDNEIDRMSSKIDFFAYDFKDYFLDRINKEINECHYNGHYLAMMLLSRKLIECLIVRIFEVVFNEDDSLRINENGRIHNLETLLNNLKANSSAFNDKKDLVEELCDSIKPLKNEINDIAHRDYKIPNKDDVDNWNVPEYLSKLRRLYIQYCNP